MKHVDAAAIGTAMIEAERYFKAESHRDIPADVIADCVHYHKNTGAFLSNKAGILFRRARIHTRNMRDKYPITSTGKSNYVIRLFGKRIPAHHAAYAIVTGEWPVGRIHFRDGDSTNYRWDNLKLVPARNPNGAN